MTRFAVTFTGIRWVKVANKVAKLSCAICFADFVV